MLPLSSRHLAFKFTTSRRQALTPTEPQAPSLEQRQAALFNSTAVHASFGDVELAQITLRGRMQAAAATRPSCDLQTLRLHSECGAVADGITAGLDFDAALKDPAMVKFQSSPQVPHSPLCTVSSLSCMPACCGQARRCAKQGRACFWLSPSPGDVGVLVACMHHAGASACALQGHTCQRGCHESSLCQSRLQPALCGAARGRCAPATARAVPRRS